MEKERSLDFPFTWSAPSVDRQKELDRLYTHPASLYRNTVISQPGNVVGTKKLAEIAEDLYNMELRPDDVWVVSYPKSGTTWTQEMVWQICNNFDEEGGKVPINLRFPQPEMQMFCDPNVEPPENVKTFFEDRKVGQTLDYVNNLPSPRFLKSHMPLTMLPPALLDTCKVVFVARNPYDCCVSYYHQEVMWPMQGFTGDFKAYQELFKEGKMLWGDYWYHLQTGLHHRHHPNLKFLWYEDMKKDLISVITDMAKFLGCHLTELEVLEIDKHLHFDNIKKNKAVNYEAFSTNKNQAFMRKGQVGDWKNFFTEEDKASWDEWMEAKKKQFNIDHEMTLTLPPKQ